MNPSGPRRETSEYRVGSRLEGVGGKVDVGLTPVKSSEGGDVGTGPLVGTGGSDNVGGGPDERRGR